MPSLAHSNREDGTRRQLRSVSPCIRASEPIRPDEAVQSKLTRDSDGVCTQAHASEILNTPKLLEVVR